MALRFTAHKQEWENHPGFETHGEGHTTSKKGQSMAPPNGPWSNKKKNSHVSIHIIYCEVTINCKRCECNSFTIGRLYTCTNKRTNKQYTYPSMGPPLSRLYTWRGFNRYWNFLKILQNLTHDSQHFLKDPECCIKQARILSFCRQWTLLFPSITPYCWGFTKLICCTVDSA